MSKSAKVVLGRVLINPAHSTVRVPPTTAQKRTLRKTRGRSDEGTRLKNGDYCELRERIAVGLRLRQFTDFHSAAVRKTRCAPAQLFTAYATDAKTDVQATKKANLFEMLTYCRARV
jgi:hypothetical protein